MNKEDMIASIKAEYELLKRNDAYDEGEDYGSDE